MKQFLGILMLLMSFLFSVPLFASGAPPGEGLLTLAFSGQFPGLGGMPSQEMVPELTYESATIFKSGTMEFVQANEIGYGLDPGPVYCGGTQVQNSERVTAIWSMEVPIIVISPVYALNQSYGFASARRSLCRNYSTEVVYALLIRVEQPRSFTAAV